MLLKELGVATKTINALEKKNIRTTNDMVRAFPRNYLDYRTITPLKDAINKDCVIAGYLESVGNQNINNRTMITANIIEETSGEKVKIQWFGQKNMWQVISRFTHQQVYVCGTVTKHPKFGYGVINPCAINLKDNFRSRIVPVYTKHKGVSEEMYASILKKALSTVTEPLEDIVFQKTKLVSYKKALEIMHNPVDFESMKEAEKRLVFNDMLYFSIMMKERSNGGRQDSFFTTSIYNTTDAFINSFPYTLTKDQSDVISNVKKHMEAGRRVNALVQGDVGCGKTVVAFTCMFMMADNGYQSAIMAPTTVLAKQHYEELKSYCEPFGFQVAYIDGTLKGKQRKEVLNGIKEGQINFVVGTHGVFQKDVVYDNLGLVVIDEEHRFGVAQREKLEEKAAMGAHVISMSATPIPRSTAEIIYGEDKEIFTIQQMPNGRKAVQTAINNSDRVIMDFIEKHLKEGRQCYVVCPLINDNEVCADLESVEQTVIKYRERFESIGFSVSTVNGKMSKEELESEINSFKENNSQILISTTVIEVGVNVPNANVIVINNAERFGIAQLHQLRGRVGRGSHQSYCILKSAYKENKRLNTLCKSTNGFEIAQADLEQRGPGDLIGTKQSGENHFMSLVLAYPNLYQATKKYADWMISSGMGQGLKDLYKQPEDGEEKSED